MQQRDGDAALRQEAAYARLLEQVAVAANSSSTSDTAFQVCLDLVCVQVGWPVGHVYRSEADGSGLVPTGLWHLDEPERFAAFRAITERTRFEKGIGLPGRVLASGASAWIPDVTKDPNFPRAKQATDIGVRAAFGFPILVGPEVVAVLEFFSARSIPPNPRLLEVMGHVGTQLGRAVERERAAEALRESQQRYAHMFEAAPVGIWVEDLSEVLAWLDALRSRGVTDLRRYLDEHPEFLRHAAAMVRVLDVNQAVLQMTGVPDKQLLLGRLDRIFADQLELLREELIAIFEGRTSFEAESSNRTLQGARLDTLVSLAIPSESSAFRHLLVCTQDITARKRAEEERAGLEAQMHEAQRLESLGLLAGGVAHDFNNLLAVILGNCRLLLDKLPAGSPLVAQIEEIRSAAQHGAGLTEQMLTYSGRRLPGALAPVDLSELVEGLLDLCRSALGGGATLEADLAAGLPPIAGDAVQLRQVVVNLVTNAGEALAGKPGRIWIRARLRSASTEDLADAVGAELAPGEYLCLEVSDPGTGMSAETRARIFEPFFTTKFTGRGLGLAAVLGIVRGHGGAIQVESEPGAGSRFRVWLPPAKGLALPERPASPTAASVAPREAEALAALDGHVLVIDDDEPMLRLAQLFLEKAGFQVTAACGGRAGIATFQDAAERFDGVLLDLAMPEVGGEQVLEAIRRLRPELPVVVMSGYAEDAARDRLGAGPRTSFLHKPFEPEALIARLRNALAVESTRS